MKVHSATLAVLILGTVGWVYVSPATAQTGAGDTAKVLNQARKVKGGAQATAAHPTGKPAASSAASLARSKGGKRDPFVSPVRAGGEAGGEPCVGGGKRCLQIDQLILRGVVKSPEGYIALVAVPTPGTSERAYFLRPNDAVFNGYVLRITFNSIVFKQNVIDKLGRTGEREVVKSITTGPSRGM
jgi:hypothetical protein